MRYLKSFTVVLLCYGISRGFFLSVVILMYHSIGVVERKGKKSVFSPVLVTLHFPTHKNLTWSGFLAKGTLVQLGEHPFTILLSAGNLKAHVQLTEEGTL